MNRYCIYLILLTLSSPAFAQQKLTQPFRYELPAFEGDYSVQAAGQLGLYLLIEKKQAAADSTDWDIIKLDTLLRENWRGQIKVKSSYKFMNQKFFNNKQYILFYDQSSRYKNMLLFVVDEAASIITSYALKNVIPFNFVNMRPMDEAILIGGFFNYRPIVILFNLNERIPRILPGVYNEEADLIQMDAVNNDEIEIVLKGKTVDNVNTLFLFKFDNEGRLLQKIVLDTDKTRALLFGRKQNLQNSANMVAGTFGRNNSDYSRGIFIANINDFGEQQIQYYNYAELKNFFNYMRAKREQRVRNRIERKKIKNKRIRFNYRLLVHQIIEHEEQYVMLGEAFYPKYKSLPSSSLGLFNPFWTVNQGYSSFDRVFEGYKYTHAVVIGFDKNGELLWDNSFEINDILSMELQQFVHASVNNDQIILLYVYDESIRTKIINKDEVIEGKEVFDITIPNENDELIKGKTQIEGLSKWHDNSFIIYGTQSIRNMRDANLQLNREVFFINKLVID